MQEVELLEELQDLLSRILLALLDEHVLELVYFAEEKYLLLEQLPIGKGLDVEEDALEELQQLLIQLQLRLEQDLLHTDDDVQEELEEIEKLLTEFDDDEEQEEWLDWQYEFEQLLVDKQLIEILKELEELLCEETLQE